MSEVVPQRVPEPGDIEDPSLGVEGDPEPLPDDDARQVEETASEDEA